MGSAHPLFSGAFPSHGDPAAHPAGCAPLRFKNELVADLTVQTRPLFHIVASAGHLWDHRIALSIIVNMLSVTFSLHCKNWHLRCSRRQRAASLPFMSVAGCLLCVAIIHRPAPIDAWKLRDGIASWPVPALGPSAPARLKSPRARQSLRPR